MRNVKRLIQQLACFYDSEIDLLSYGTVSLNPYAALGYILYIYIQSLVICTRVNKIIFHSILSLDIVFKGNILALSL